MLPGQVILPLHLLSVTSSPPPSVSQDTQVSAFCMAKPQMRHLQRPRSFWLVSWAIAEGGEQGQSPFLECGNRHPCLLELSCCWSGERPQG